MVSEQRFMEWWNLNCQYYIDNNVTMEVAFKIWSEAIYYNVSERDKLVTSIKDRLQNTSFKPKYRKYG